MGTIHTVIKDSNDVVLAEYATILADELLINVINTFAAAHRYNEFLIDNETPNPETKGDFMLRKMREYLSEVVSVHASNVAAEAARAAIDANKVVL